MLDIGLDRIYEKFRRSKVADDHQRENGGPALWDFPSAMKRLGMGLCSQKSQFEFVGPLSRARGETQRLPVLAHLPVCKTPFYGSVDRFHAAPLHKGHV